LRVSYTITANNLIRFEGNISRVGIVSVKVKCSGYFERAAKEKWITSDVSLAKDRPISAARLALRLNALDKTGITCPTFLSA
jgi:hypothetical protein